MFKRKETFRTHINAVAQQKKSKEANTLEERFRAIEEQIKNMNLNKSSQTGEENYGTEYIAFTYSGFPVIILCDFLCRYLHRRYCFNYIHRSFLGSGRLYGDSACGCRRKI